MPKKYLIGLAVILVLALAVWLVPLALASGGASTAPTAQNASPAPSQGSGTTHQCPAGGGSGGSSSNSSSSYQIY
jgi:hypothetical protein